VVSAGAICPEHAKRLFQIETEMKSGKEVRSQNKDRIYWIDRILSRLEHNDSGFGLRASEFCLLPGL
jgi:hypothetical protein